MGQREQNLVTTVPQLLRVCNGPDGGSAGLLHFVSTLILDLVGLIFTLEAV